MDPYKDTIAEFYEWVSDVLRPDELTEKEVTLILDSLNQTQLPVEEAKILDIGAGTGRLSIPLLKLGAEVTCVEPSSSLLNMLRTKINAERASINVKTRLHLKNANVLDDLSPYEAYFDLILLFWNTFNEIALSEKSIHKLMDLLYQSLKPNGLVIINSDDPNLIEFKNLQFSQVLRPNKGYYTNSEEYFVTWKTIDWEDNYSISLSEESIWRKNGNMNHKVELLAKTKIRQRWFTLDQYVKISSKHDFKLERVLTTWSRELYLKLTKF